MNAHGALLELKAVLAILIINGNLKFGHPTSEQRYRKAAEAIESMNERINRKYVPIPADWHKDERHWV